MIQKLKLFLASIMVAAPVLLGAAPVLAQAGGGAAVDDDKRIGEGICIGAKIALGGSSCTDDGTADDKVSGLIKSVIDIISIIVGVVAVIMIIIGGLRYITSGGDSSSVTSAKNTILYAIVGLVVVAMAQLIVRFVIGRLNEANK